MTETSNGMHVNCILNRSTYHDAKGTKLEEMNRIDTDIAK